MEKTKRTRDKRKLLLMMPLLIMPFLALGFYAMGGGSGVVKDSSLAGSGINTALPDASFKSDDPTDKMGFYKKAGKELGSDSGALDKLRFSVGEDPKTAEIDAKLAALHKEINVPVSSAVESKGATVGSATKVSIGDGAGNSSGMKDDVDRLELMMKTMQEGKGKDPEMEQMSGLLEKILEIQNPELARQKAVANGSAASEVSKFAAISAVVAGNQKVVQGSSVKLRLMDSLVIDGVVIPSGHLVYGLCRLARQRVLLDIKQVRLGNLIIPVDLSVYGLDGMAGIAAPDAVFADAVGDGAGDAVSGISVYGLDGIGGQVAGAGIDAAKSLLSRRARVVKVKLSGELPVLLRNNKWK